MLINFDDFKKLDLCAVNVLEAERVEGSEKLLKLQVDLSKEKRQIVAGVGKAYAPEDLVGRQIIIIANLEPRVIFGLKSQGMLLAASNSEGNPVLIMPEKEVMAGAKIV